MCIRLNIPEINIFLSLFKPQCCTVSDVWNALKLEVNHPVPHWLEISGES